jgi:hypothetical protein
MCDDPESLGLSLSTNETEKAPPKILSLLAMAVEASGNSDSKFTTLVLFSIAYILSLKGSMTLQGRRYTYGQVVCDMNDFSSR